MMHSRLPPDRPPPPSPKCRHDQHIFLPSMTSSSNDTNETIMVLPEVELPSCIRDGITPEQERTLRRKTCRFLEEASRKLKLPRVATATSMVFLHRFYSVHAFSEHDRFEVAVACLLLAAKTEESPKKLANVIQECWRLRNIALKRVSDQKCSGCTEGGQGLSHSMDVISSGHSLIVKTDMDTTVTKNVIKDGNLDIKCEEFTKLRERILLLERVILHTIGFELSIDHPYKFLVEKVNKLVLSPARQLEYIKTPPKTVTHKAMANELIQYAMNFANDSMHTSLCLQFPPEIIASSCVYMSAQYCGLKLMEGRGWLEILGGNGRNLDMQVLVSIAMQIMELISDKKGCNKSIFNTIRADLEKLRDPRDIRSIGDCVQCHHLQRRPAMGNAVGQEIERDTKRPRV